MERGLSWEKAVELHKKTMDNNEENIENESNKNGLASLEGFYISNQIKNNHRIPILAISTPLTGAENPSCKKFCSLSIYRPNTGLQVRQETPESLNKKYKKVTLAEAKVHWNEQYHKSAVECTHVYRQAHCVNVRNCEVGLRTRRFHILAGSVLTVWTKVENVLSTLTGSSQFRLQIIRAKSDDNHKIVGCVIPNMCLKHIDSLLASMSSKTYVHNHISIESEEIAPILKTSKSIPSALNRLGSSQNSLNNKINSINNKNCENLNNFSNKNINFDFT